MTTNRLVSKYRLSDIASELGVSVSTVSRALSGTGRMNPETRKKILHVAQRVYDRARPTAPAITKRMIGLFTPSYGASLGMGTSIAHVVQDAVRQVCETKGYGLVFSSFGNPAQPTLGDELLDSGSLAGLILYRTKDESGLARELSRCGAPFIFAYRDLEGTGLNYVGIDAREVIQTAVAHCLTLGFSEIGLLCGDVSFPSHRSFRDEFLRAAAERKVPVEDGWVQEVQISEEQGYAAAARLIAGSCPRALICCSDRIAFGALRAAGDLRKHVPKDLAILTIDGTVQTAFTRPALTAIQIPWFDMFSMAARLLLEMIPDSHAIHQVAVKMACKLVVRESTANLRAARRAS